MNLLRDFGIGPLTRATRERDKALIVSFLQSHGPSDVLDISTTMNKHTRGLHDWTFWSDSVIYALLRELEAEGAVSSKPDRIHGRLYSLVAPVERLLSIEL